MLFKKYNTISNDGQLHTPGCYKYFCINKKCSLYEEEVFNDTVCSNKRCPGCKTFIRAKCKFCKKDNYILPSDQISHMHYVMHEDRAYERYGYD